MSPVYNKLVRDRIPDIIQAAGRTCTTEILGDEEYRHALQEKLVEEAHEAAHADRVDLITELADLQEVIEAVLRLEGIAREDVAAEQRRRREERGGFERRLCLVWAE